MKKLLIEEMKRLIKLLETTKEYEICEWSNKNRAEIKRKMHELRRDTIAYEKHLYDYGNRKALEGYPHDK